MRKSQGSQPNPADLPMSIANDFFDNGRTWKWMNLKIKGIRTRITLGIPPGYRTSGADDDCVNITSTAK